MFLSKDATCCEVANNVFLRLARNVKCDREMRFQIFFLQKVFLWIRSRDHVWSFHHLCFDCSTRFFSKWRTRLNSIFRSDKNLTKRLIKFDENDSLNLTKATHQTRYERSYQTWLDDFSSNLTDDISSNLTSCISSNLMSDILSNLMSDISSNFERERQFSYFLISDFMHRHIVWET
jgi:hypothetical protein